MTTRTIHVRIGLSLLLGLLVISGGLRQAQGAEPRRLGVVTFRGPGEGATRNVVMKVGKTSKYQIVGGQQISKAAGKLHVTLDTNDSFKAVAKELGIAAFITGEVTKKKATLTVRNGLDGSVSAEASWTGANPRKLSVAVSKTLWRRLGSAIDRTKAPTGAKAAAVAEEEAPETGADDAGGDESEEKAKDKGKAKADEKKAPVAAAEPADEPGAEKRSKKSKKAKKTASNDEEGSETVVTAGPEAEDDEGGPSQEALIVSVGTRVVNRSLSYVQDIGNVRNSKYNLAAAPEVDFHIDLFPAAFGGGGGFASNIGLTVDVAYMLPVVSSATPTMAQGGNGLGKYATYSLDWAVGAKVRLPMGLYGMLGYGAHRYQLIAQGGAAGIDVPMVDYRSFRAGIGARIHVTPEVVVMAHGSYLHCLGALGQIGSRNFFPKATCNALDAGAAVGYRINSFLEAQVGVDLRRYGLAFHVLPTDNNPRVAGGAVDQYLMGWAALAVVLGGASEGGGGGGGGKASSGDDEESDAPKDGEKAEKAKGDDEASEDDAGADEEKPAKKKKKSAAAEIDL